MHVCVLGAGIVGLATAWQLEPRRAMQVTRDRPRGARRGRERRQRRAAELLLRAAAGRPVDLEAVAQAAALALLAAQAAAAARPAAVALGPGLPGGLQRARPRATPRPSCWRWRRRAARPSKPCWPTSQPDCDFSATGKLVLYAQRGLAGVRPPAGRAAARTMGSQQDAWSRPTNASRSSPRWRLPRRRWPAPSTRPSECAADCLKVCTALDAGAARARRALPARLPRCRASCARRAASPRCTTSAGDIEADAFVMALGTASHRLGRQLGAYLPVYPLKGYSITVDVDPYARRRAAR